MVLILIAEPCVVVPRLGFGVGDAAGGPGCANGYKSVKYTLSTRGLPMTC
jgi:hypothetical protein